jgi:hypothetical protein
MDCGHARGETQVRAAAVRSVGDEHRKVDNHCCYVVAQVYQRPREARYPLLARR